MNQRCRSRGCALVFAQNLSRALHETPAGFAVAQKLSNLAFK
jgi:hypothetical protein